jgi:hypothetical protein
MIKRPETDNKPTILYLGGALIGLIAGVTGAYLYQKSVNESNQGERPPVKTMDLYRIIVTLLGVVRLITDLGAKK